MELGRHLRKLTSIQALRGLAALMVLLFHVMRLQSYQVPASNSAERDWLSGIWERGYAGVDLFFVISGFIMVYTTQSAGQGLPDIKRFFKARITRVYPLWWVYAGLMAVYFWIVYGFPADMERAAGSGGLAVYLAKSFLLIPQDAPPVLGVGWSLLHEMYFYIIFGLLLFLPRRALPWALGAWGAAVLIGFLAGWGEPYAEDIKSLAAHMLTLEFIAGAMAAWVITKGHVYVPKLLGIAGAALLALACLIYAADTEATLIWQRAAIFTLPCAMMVYGFAGHELSTQRSAPKWAERLGDWSYSLYLSHFLVLSALIRIFAELSETLPSPLSKLFNIGAPGIAGNLVFIAAGITASLIVAALSYWFIERPLAGLFQKRRTVVYAA